MLVIKRHEWRYVEVRGSRYELAMLFLCYQESLWPGWLSFLDAPGFKYIRPQLMMTLNNIVAFGVLHLGCSSGETLFALNTALQSLTNLGIEVNYERQ